MSVGVIRRSTNMFTCFFALTNVCIFYFFKEVRLRSGEACANGYRRLRFKTSKCNFTNKDYSVWLKISVLIRCLNNYLFLNIHRYKVYQYLLLSFMYMYNIKC